MKRLIRHATPVSAILIPAAFFLLVVKPDNTEPNAFIYLAYLGFSILTFTFIVPGIGLVKARHR
jgi:hypothetical protein